MKNAVEKSDRITSYITRIRDKPEILKITLIDPEGKKIRQVERVSSIEILNDRIVLKEKRKDDLIEVLFEDIYISTTTFTCETRSIESLDLQVVRGLQALQQSDDWQDFVLNRYNFLE